MENATLREIAHRLHLQIAIDGPAGAGKSTVGSRVASVLKCEYLDTGLMYRAVALLALERSIRPTDAVRLCEIAARTRFESPQHGLGLLVDGESRESDLRSSSVDVVVSQVSSHAGVREALVRKQREFARDKCVVMVGRDIGTTVLSDAPVKLWVTASPEERARRRLKEGLAGSSGLTEAEMADRIRARDAIDASRVVSPLRRAEDAVILNTDALDGDAAVGAALAAIAESVKTTWSRRAWRSE